MQWSRARGWRPTGVDASLSMLDLARERGGPAICGDMRSLPLQGVAFDRITCMYDSLNHLLEERELVAAFRSIGALMHRDSMFWFDVNHPDAYVTVWASDEPFESIGDDWELRIATSFDRSRRLATAVVTGYATVGQDRVLIDEVHHQRPWTESEIRRALKAAQMRVVWKTRFEPFGQGGDADGLKVLYAAEKKE